MEQGLPFTTSLARLTRTRSMETVVTVPLPPPNQAAMDEQRMQCMERAAATSNQMTYEQLAQFHAQQSAMAQRLEEETAMTAAMEKNRQEQEESRAVLSRQQEDLVRQHEELKRAMAEQARIQELDLDAMTKAMTSLKMDTKIRDAESRVGRLLADFYEKLEQLVVAHLPEQEPKQSVKILTAAIRPLQSTRETNKAYKSDVRSFCRWLGLKCGRDEHRVFKCPKRNDAKRKFIGADVDPQDALVIDCPRTIACDVNDVTALALLDSGADKSVVSPTFLARVENVGNFTLAVRQLYRPIELGGFMEAMKLTVDREVKLRLTLTLPKERWCYRT
ncbi:hypothetical protein DYB32_009970 [Aphanomyces invadans]|uniref:Peptidase A2 domain-containing protein n=1 Tax=Aphanomyces invadans TaxID=157072 RepID=A0A418AGQ4_9STRA|nr:hypothetical protein DYB32_009970 [Aphanomyces invadans]